MWFCALACTAQSFDLKKQHDSLYYLNGWRLPYPVYQYQTGDVDGDGRTDAIVGVIKSTRFYPEKARRIFIFKVDRIIKLLQVFKGSCGLLPDGKLVFYYHLLGQVADRDVGLTGNSAASGLLLAADNSEHGGLTGTVLTDKRDLVTLVDHVTDVLEQHLAAELNLETLD